MVNATSEWPMRWLSAFQSIFGVVACGGVAVPDVVQVDLRQPGRRGELLEPPGNRVGVRRPAVRPAEQHAVIVVLRAEVPPLLVELLDVCLEDVQGEWVERQDVLSVLGLAVRFDHPAVHDDAGNLDRERARVKRRRCATPGPALPAPGSELWGARPACPRRPGL
jgi:hypothetical protein